MLKIITQRFMEINTDKNTTSIRPMTEKFEKHIINKINSTLNDNNNRHYQKRSEHTDILMFCEQIILGYLAKQKEDLFKMLFDDIAEKIAKKLMRTERDINQQISQLKTEVLEGSLVISFIIGSDLDDQNEDENIFSIIIAKVQHTEYFGERDLELTTGISKDESKIWRRAQFKFFIEADGSVCFDEALLFLNKEAKYWADKFLELDEMHSDETNTKKAYEATSRILSNSLAEHKRDYVIIYNSFLGKFKTQTQNFNYNRTVNDILDNYEPSEEDFTKEKLNKLKNDLLKLPEKKNFDVEFNITPNVIKQRPKRYEITKGIMLNILDYVENISSIIESYKDESTGNKYIRIKTDNDETYNSFLRKS